MVADRAPDADVGERPRSGSADRQGIEVIGFDRTAAGFAPLDQLADLAATTLLGEGMTAGRLDLVAVDVDEMAELNAAHLGHDGPTDVLSFPLDADDLLVDPTNEQAGDLGGDGPPVHLGDVIICPEVARGQAADHCGTEEAELSLLVIHGVLHVLGHDHAEPEEAEAMQARERHHLAALGHRHPGPQGASC